jgi:phage tail tape measure protein, TP901 family, core region
MGTRYAVETIFRLIDNITSPLDKIGVKGSKVGAKLKNDFSAAQKTLDNVGKKIQKAVSYASAAAGGAVVGFTIKGVKDALDLSTAMAKVSTVANTTPTALAGMQKALIKLSNATGMAVTDLAGAQYEAISAGIDTASSVDFVGVAVKAAKGGFTDTTTAINGLTTVLNAYGLKADQATKISDQMIIAQNLGKTTFGEMAATLGNVIPVASALNVGTDELFSSIATLTAFGIKTPEAMTGMKAALSNIIKPSAEASKMAQQLGIDFSATALQSKGLKRFLDDVAKSAGVDPGKVSKMLEAAQGDPEKLNQLARAAGGGMQKMATLFGSVEALNSVTVLTSKGSDLFTKSLDQMANSAGATNQAFEIMQSTPAERMNRALNKMRNAGISLGGALSPVFEKIADKISIFGDELNKVDFKPIADKAGKALDNIAKLAQLIWNLRVPIIAVTSAILLYKGGMLAAAAVDDIATNAKKTLSVVTTIFNIVTKGSLAIIRSISSGQALWTLKLYASIAAEKIASASTAIFSGAIRLLNLAFVSSPIGWIILGIGALIAIIVLCVTHWKQITAAVSAAWSWITKTASAIWNMATGALTSLGGKLAENSNKVLGFIAIFTGPFAFVISIIKELVSNWDNVTNAFKSDGILGAIKAIGGAILSGIMAPIQGILETIGKIPGIGKWASDAAAKMQGVRDQLTGKTPQTIDVAQRIIPAAAGGKATAMPATRTATALATTPSGARIPATVTRPAPSVPGMSQTIATATTSPVAPVTNRDVMESYEERITRSRVDVVVGAERGATARVSGKAPTPGVALTRSGGTK